LRKAFIRTLAQIAEDDERVLLLTTDLGYMALEEFRERFPARFYNCGVAEQNMVGMATGLAEAGYIPFAYSIATFAALRAFEFIRNGPVLHRLPVRIVGMGMGFEYGHAGPTHHAVEDVAALRTLPGLSIVIAADSAQTETALRDTWNAPGPVYYSLGKDDRASVPGLNGRFAMDRVQVVREGGDIALAAMGSIAAEVAVAADELSAQGIEACVIVVSSFNPDPADDLARVLASHALVISVEAQSISGGLAAMIATTIASRGLPCRLWPLAVHASPDGSSGSQQDRWRKHGLDRREIVRTALRALTDSSRSL
jgi:transketolase